MKSSVCRCAIELCGAMSDVRDCRGTSIRKHGTQVQRTQTEIGTVKTQSCTAHFALVVILVLFWAQPAMAYIGPGAGLSAIGAFFGLLAGIVIALFGFVWYPVKRLLRMRRQRRERKSQENS